MSLGERLRKLRRSRKFSAELLADACGVKAGAYRRWERDETEPSITQTVELSRIYQMSVDALLFGEDDNSSMITVGIEPGEQIMVRISGNTAKARVKYEPAVSFDNVLAEDTLEINKTGS